MKKFLLAMMFVACVCSVHAKPVKGKSRKAAMKKTENAEVKTLWEQTVALDKELKGIEDKAEKKEKKKELSKLYVKIDGMLAAESPEYKKLFDEANASKAKKKKEE